EPPMGSILRMFAVPPNGGDTLFASMYAAYEALSDRMKEMLDGLTAIHDGAPYYEEVNRIIGRDGGGKAYPQCEHPVVRVHPDSGRKCLYLSRMFTHNSLIGLAAHPVSLQSGRCLVNDRLTYDLIRTRHNAMYGACSISQVDIKTLPRIRRDCRTGTKTSDAKYQQHPHAILPSGQFGFPPFS
ncbi:MAG: TauD/TfdA family dioxygenase, partial [Candidatus Marinimicrobia bacterium]|nr:TauD/TfdA family dioxygenase [Candidatus Neomarinimicrobiota bacterium]